jgi:hypothetical protein
MIFMIFVSMYSVIICVVLPWRTYETHPALSLKSGCDSLALYKIRQFFRGIKLDIGLAPLLEPNVVLNARASPIIKHASNKFKLLIFKFMLGNFSI